MAEIAEQVVPKAGGQNTAKPRCEPIPVCRVRRELQACEQVDRALLISIGPPVDTGELRIVNPLRGLQPEPGDPRVEPDDVEPMILLQRHSDALVERQASPSAGVLEDGLAADADCP